MHSPTRFLLIAGLAAIAMANAGCSSDSQAAAPDPDVVALQQAVAALTTRVNALEAQDPQLTADLQALRDSVRDTVRLRGSGPAVPKRGLAVASAMELGTEVGTLVTLSDTNATLFSPTGYVFSITPSDDPVAVDPVAWIHYSNADCTGTMYVNANDLNVLAPIKGTVFGLNGPDSLDPAWFFQVPPGATPTLFSFASRRTNTSDCEVIAGGGDGYEVIANDEEDTGVPSGLYPEAFDIGPTPTT